MSNGIISATELKITGDTKAPNGKYYGGVAEFTDVSANNVEISGNLGAKSGYFESHLEALSLDLRGDLTAKNVSFATVSAGKFYNNGNTSLAAGRVIVSAENGDITGTGCLTLNGSVSAASFHAKRDIDAKGDFRARSGKFQDGLTANHLIVDGGITSTAGALVCPEISTGDIKATSLGIEGNIEAVELTLNANLHMKDGILDAKSATIAGDIEMGGTLHAKDLSAKGDIKAPDGTLTTDTIEAVRLILKGSAAAACLRVKDYICADTIHLTGELSCAGVNADTTGGAPNVNVDAKGNLKKSTSSRQYKLPAGNYKTGLQKIKQITPVSYRHKESPEGQIFAGMYAEDMDAIGLKEFVIYQNDKPDGIAYGNMAALFVNAFKELDARMAALESRK